VRPVIVLADADTVRVQQDQVCVNRDCGAWLVGVSDHIKVAFRDRQIDERLFGG
jgi:hypothetical protein